MGYDDVRNCSGVNYRWNNKQILSGYHQEVVSLVDPLTVDQTASPTELSENTVKYNDAHRTVG